MLNKNIVYGGVIISILFSIVGLVGGHQSVQLSQSDIKAIAAEINQSHHESIGGTTNYDALALAAPGSIAFYTFGGVEYATVELPFIAATNTPVFIPNPFPLATSTFGYDGIQVQVTGNTQGDFTFDIATTTVSGAATTSNVLAKGIVVSSASTYDGSFYPNTATSSIVAGVLPGVSATIGNLGATNWFLRGNTTEGVMLRIASTTVSQSFTGTMSVTFKKP